MKSLKILSKYSTLGKALEIANHYCEKLDLIPVIHAYFEDEIISNVVKTLEPRVRDIYNEFKFDKTLFIKNSLRMLNIKEDNFLYYPYYAIPIGNETVVNFVDNSTIPPKALIIRGVVRFTFMAYNTYSQLEKSISSRQEEDIVVEFEDGKVKSYSRKRNIFTDANVVSKILSSNEKVLVNLTLPYAYYLMPSLLSMNVIPYENKVLITKSEENLDFKIIEGKASKGQIMKGDTLHPRFKLEIYYDYKSKGIIKEEIARGLAYKIPL